MKIFITGASKGIGKYLLEQFLNRQEDVYGTYSHTEPSHYCEHYNKVDVGNTEEVQSWISDHATEKDDIVLINCAGINYNSTARRANVEEWSRVIDVNLIGTFRVINAVLPLMYERNFGRIINFSSIVAQKGVIGTSAYAASKSALWGMSRAIAVENAHKGITINNINLGYVNIGMTLNDVPEKLQKKMLEQIPMQSFGEAEDILKTVQHLIDSPYITGSSIDLNGGLY